MLTTKYLLVGNSAFTGREIYGMLSNWKVGMGIVVVTVVGVRSLGDIAFWAITCVLFSTRLRFTIRYGIPRSFSSCVSGSAQVSPATRGVLSTRAGWDRGGILVSLATPKYPVCGQLTLHLVICI